MPNIVDRQHANLPVFGLPRSSDLRRWVSLDSHGSGYFFGLAHGEPPPDAGPLIVVGILSQSEESRASWFAPRDTLANMLILGVHSRDDPAFHHDSRDQLAIERVMHNIDPDTNWGQRTLDLNGDPVIFESREMSGDWVGFADIGGEYLWIHAQQPGTQPIGIVRLDDLTPYLPG